MTKTERAQLDELLSIAEERDCPLTDWEREFLRSLDAGWRDRDMTPRQADCFDRIVDKHLRGD